jgi:hypothetical protein
VLLIEITIMPVARAMSADVDAEKSVGATGFSDGSDALPPLLTIVSARCGAASSGM